MRLWRSPPDPPARRLTPNAEFWDNRGSSRIIGFDPGLDRRRFRTGGIDSIVMQRTYDMGHVAMNLMLAQLKGESVPGVTVLPPLLMTRENLDSAEISSQLTANWWASE
jgi:ABC-type sugar transport system substrate-binding protein